ncbi:MAG: hypothetical protein FWD18_10610 [Micrococcales bacterium]|nr:hypothetical protein [Micrococcales bacterium]
MSRHLIRVAVIAILGLGTVLGTPPSAHANLTPLDVSPPVVALHLPGALSLEPATTTPATPTPGANTAGVLLASAAVALILGAAIAAHRQKKHSPSAQTTRAERP